MYFSKETLAANSRLGGHWNELWANRNMWNANHNAMIAANRAHMTQEWLAVNAAGGFTRDFWAEIDRQVLQLRDQEVGMEIINDLIGVQTVLSVGKTAKLYSVVGDIADDVSVSIDGQAPFSFDHTEYASDGDPIPVFTAGYGVNWRHAAGLNSVGIDLVLDSQMAKMRKFNQKRVNYYLNGDPNIQVQSYPAQGIKNHRNTKKLNLGAGAGGANIDLTAATMTQLFEFFGKGAFGALARANKVAQYDVMWVSPEIWANLAQPYVVNGVVSGTVLQAVLPFAPVKEIRMTFALKGNEFVAYVRRRDVISPLVGMAVGVVPLPRPVPNVNYNFQIMSAEGLQITADDQGLSGVVYGANLA
ncbi:major capsid protein [Serratia sp. TSA_130.2]|uniref:major capsid protein n=1 Tax=unclassified Serratia (in: enterobacteria) TaxID=2647522 RepID=UPI003377A77C